jgi:hypothetical protein
MIDVAMTTIAGIYRDGRIELAEQPQNVAGEARVLVTFLEPGQIELAARGIGPAEADELRARLGTFPDEWDSPEMSAYDNYDANRQQLETR